MRKIFLLIFSLTSIAVFCQKSQIENLVNSFSKEFISEDFEYYNLVDKSFNPKFDVWCLNESIEDAGLDKEISFFKEGDFTAIKNDIDWNDYNLEKAKIYSHEKIPKFNSALYEYILVDRNIDQRIYDSMISNKKFNQVILKGNSKLSNKKKRIKFNKKLAFERSRIRKENQDFYQISIPLFSSNKDFAVIFYQDCCKRNGYLYVYSDNEWKEYLQFYRSIFN
ncbi:hypothetical protein [Chryseobacterium aquaticum]|uniref:hypothetical protein n=1 Tax=Chryseobacterium aquaticum TaxID=452084 RepID=UPI003F6F4FCC